MAWEIRAGSVILQQSPAIVDPYGNVQDIGTCSKAFALLELNSMSLNCYVVS